MSTGGSEVRSSVLASSPEELRQAARALRSLGSEVGHLAGSLGQLGSGGATGWMGLAALEHAARTESTAALVALLAGPGEEAAAALERVASTAAECSGRVRFWTRVLDDAVDELHRLRTLGVPPDVLEQEAWRRRVVELEDTAARCRGVIDEAERDYAHAQRTVAELVTQVWGPVEQAVDHATVLGQAAAKVLAARSRAVALSIAAPGLWSLAQARRMGDPALRARAETMARARLKLFRSRAARLASAVDKVGKRLPTWLRPPGAAGGPFLAVMQWWGAWEDLEDGAGYSGWRGETTKFFSAMAVVGIPASFAPAPPVALAGIGMTASYSLWMGGNWIYDHRGQIGSALRGAQRAGATVQRWGTRQVIRGALGAADLSRRAMDRLQVRAKDLVTLGARGDELTQGLRDRLRKLGRPLRLPQTPIRAPRLPVGLENPWPYGGRLWGFGGAPPLRAVP